ncbi:hypothetical protein GCM10022399_44450 [Terrabacter ginsenosidimutans]|uniref:ASCH domain-containing protein n=1 Tax=Terrabacter ginsenosidimutans TaxID=490575 RepID=A0ABP7EQV3_9MICO
MLFSRDLRERVAGGEVTVSIRLWSRPQVKEGCRYRTAGVVIEIDSIEVLPFSAVTDDDVAASGEADRESLRDRAAHAGPIGDNTLVHRVEFHVV